jgi:CRISPR-associated RAMP protein (TIGR02581 family)
MLKRLVNELRCDLTITTTGPVLIKSGQATVDGPDMTPVRTYRNNGWEVYLPGSSLKGVFRSHLERVCRTLWPGVVCNPFTKVKDTRPVQHGPVEVPEFADAFCGDKFEVREKGKVRASGHTWERNKKEELKNPQVYADSCPICRLFGSTSFIGRLSIGDAYLAEPKQRQPVELRDGVGIDRLTGGAYGQAKFELQTVSSGTRFVGSVLLRNFECWQLGMFLTAVADLRDGLVRVGSGKSRGLGAVAGQVENLEIHLLGRTPTRQPGEIWGLGRFLSDGSYGTRPDDALTVAPMPKEEQRSLRLALTFDATNSAQMEDVARADFIRRLDAWGLPNGMQWQSAEWRESP